MWSTLCFLVVFIGPIKGQASPSSTSIDEEQEEISIEDEVGRMAQPYLDHMPCPWNSLMGPLNIEGTPSTTKSRRFIPVLVLEPEKRRESTVATFLNWEYAITLSRNCNYTSASLFDEQVLIKNITVIETQSFPLLGDFCLLKVENLRDLEEVLPKSFFPCFQDPMTQTFKDSLDLLRPAPTQLPTVSPDGEGSTDNFNDDQDDTGFGINPDVDNSGVDNFGIDNFGIDNFGIDNFGIDNFGIDNFGIDNPGIDNFGIDNFGIDNFGIVNFGTDNFGIDYFGIDIFGVPTDVPPSVTTTTSSTPSFSGSRLGRKRKRRTAPGEPLVSTVLKDCYVQAYRNLEPALNPISKLTVYIGKNTNENFRRHLGQFLPTTGDHSPNGLILKGSPVYCMYGDMPILYGLHKGVRSFSVQKVIHNLDNQMAWLRRAILGVNEPEFVSYSSDTNLTSSMSAAAFNMNFRQFEFLDCNEAILNISTSDQITIHSPYGAESVEPGFPNDDLIVKGNFTAIMITQDQPGHADINLQCLDATKELRHRLPNLSCAEFSSISTASRDRRALNSLPVESSSWPWVASVRSQGTHRCGAILLSPTRVLTAASCVSETKQDLLTVAIGDHDRSQLPSVMVKRIRTHPKFRTIDHFDNNNLAILDIEPPENAESFQTPCLMEDYRNIAKVMEEEKPECFIAGWGASNTADNIFYLRAGSFKVKTNSCRTKKNPTPEDLLRDQEEDKEYFIDPLIEICQKNDADEVSPSPGDVGGPVYCILDGKIPFLAGIIGKVRVDGDPMKFTIQYFQEDFAYGTAIWESLSLEDEVSTPFGGDYKKSFMLRPGEVKILSERFGNESVEHKTWSVCKNKRMSVTGWIREGEISLTRIENQRQIDNETVIYESVSENLAQIVIEDFEIASSEMSPHRINIRFANGNQGQAEISVSFFCAHVMVTESMTSQTSSELLPGFYKMSNPRSNVVRRWEFGSVCPDGYDVFVDRFPEGPGGELNVKQRRFQAPAGFNLMFTPSQWYQDADFTISWKCLNLSERQYQTTFILKFHQFVPCGRRLTDTLMENAELMILSAQMNALEKESQKSITGSVVYSDHFQSSFEVQDCKGPFKLASRNLLLKLDNHFSFHEELREKLASFFDRNNKVESSFEILSTHDHVLGDGSPFVQLNGPAKEIDPILGHIRRFSFTEEVFLRDGGKCERHGDEEESFLFRPRTKEENRALAEYGSTPIAWDWGEKSTYDNYTKSFEVLQPDGSWNVKEDRILYRALPTCVFKSDLCPNFFYDKRAQALKKKIIIREITAGKRPGRYSVKRRYMKSLLFDLTKRFAITSNTETKARSGFLEGTVLRVQCKKWQEKAPMSIRCTRIGEDPHLRFIICKNNVCNEDFNEKELRFFEIDNLNRCSQYSS